jgi:hypothetical protein
VCNPSGEKQRRLVYIARIEAATSGEEVAGVVKRHQHHYEAPQEINGIEPRDWAMRQGWGGRPVQVEQAQGESGRGVRDGTLLRISVGRVSAGRTCRRCEVSILLAFGCRPWSTADVDGASRVGEHLLHHFSG